MSTLISIIIPTYGRPSTLKRAVESVVKQTYSNLEIIVVDDNNPDTLERQETEKIIGSFNDQRLIYLQHPYNKNGAAARNTGIKHASGSYISFLDDDDEYEPNKIASQLSYIIDNKRFGIVYCLASNIKNNNVYYKTSYNKKGDIQYDILAMQHEVYTPSLLIESKILMEIQGFDESFKRHQDYDLLLRINEKWDIGCVNDYLVKIHNDDTINQPNVDDYVKNKELFLTTFNSFIHKYPPKLQRNIYSIHYFDICFYALKRHQLKKALIYLKKSRPNWHTIQFAINKYTKIKSRRRSN